VRRASSNGGADGTLKQEKPCRCGSGHDLPISFRAVSRSSLA